jgi:antitoxin component YwqK of YwqJK toxin-antitoxin module
MMEKYINSIKKSVLLSIFLLSFTGILYSQLKTNSEKDRKEIITDAGTKIILVTAANFSPGSNMTAIEDSSNHLQFVIDADTPVPFNQSAVKQSTEPASLGPNPEVPYFTVRFAMPIPPAYTRTDVAALTGMDSMVFRHNHSPGFEILPNGDALAIYFSTPAGKSEADSSTSFVQARLRYGSEDWDMPELFFKTQGYNDQSGLLWNDNGKLWFFGGGRNISDFVPFRIVTSMDNGATWTYSLPQIDRRATSYTAQPITSAFRGPDRSIYFAMDGDGSESFLWRSSDDGIHWHDMGGRTGGRHSVIIPLDNKGNLLSIGGKNSDVNGWSPSNVSTDWGATWSKSTPSPFPPLGSAQRPSLIRLASGHLLFVSDSYLHKFKKAPPEGWEYGDNCIVAISKDNGASWHIKTLPVQIPGHQRIDHPTLGYVTVRQAPNGVIHLLTTVTLPCLHYEFNEAWIWSDAGDIAPETSGGTIREFSESYPNGQVRSKWSAQICPNGRYLLHGEEVDYYEDGARQHQVIYENGRKTGEETFWLPDGIKVWTWNRDLKNNRGVWTHYWSNGKKKIESMWNIRPEARAMKRQFFGYEAEGSSRHWNEQGDLVASYHFVKGNLMESKPLSEEGD